MFNQSYCQVLDIVNSICPGKKIFLVMLVIDREKTSSCYTHGISWRHAVSYIVNKALMVLLMHFTFQWKHLNRITVSISLHQFRLLVRSIWEPAKGGIQNNSTPMHVIICATNPAIDMEMSGLSLWQHSLTIGGNDLPVR